MANLKRHFIAGRMNKSVDERLVPNGEYVDAMNVRLGSTEESEIGSVESSKGNELLTAINLGTYSDVQYDLSSNARCIGAFEDGTNETIYWFIHDNNASDTGTNKADLIVSYNTNVKSVEYHVISFKNDDDPTNTTLNFNSSYLISNVNKVGNFLFFTDNYNPPRKINVNSSYGYPTSITGSDNFEYNDILVILDPPAQAPLVTGIDNPSITDTFMQDRFICFGYRYEYADGEYSATSQFTNPSFLPKPFELSPESGVNDGMVNSINTAEVTFFTGSSQVKSVEILFKESDSGTIKVIEKLNKKDLNYLDNTNYTYLFTDSKIFTILSEGEILRLYDNVPLLAKTQTLMGNRIMYGNYVEGYDLKRGGQNTRLSYTVDVNSTDIGFNALSNNGFNNVGYTINPASSVTTLGNVVVDLSNIQDKLTAGSAFSFSFRLAHNSFNAAEILGPEKATNGNFNSATDWTQGSTGWTLNAGGNGLAEHNITGTTTIYQNMGLIFGRSYNVEWVVDYITSGTIRLSGGTITGDDAVTTPGTKNSVIVGNGSSFQFLASGNCGISSVSVKEIISSNISLPTSTNNNMEFGFTYILPQNFSNTTELLNSTDFQDKLGLSSSIVPISTACERQTLTDRYNCALSDTLQGGYSLYSSGISAVEQPIIAGPSSGTEMSLVVLAAVYTNDPALPVIGSLAFEYFDIAEAEFSFQQEPSSASLHSNRGYEVGIVYMDEFNRATTALVSESNTVYIPCSASPTKNKVVVNIPTSQLAPDFAKRYKFVIKPDGEQYETIYSNIYFKDSESDFTYFLLEGENIAKVEEGDRYIVKRDSTGPMRSCAQATVLEKKAQAEDFITALDSEGNSITVPAGTYMKMMTTNFAAGSSSSSFNQTGIQSSEQNVPSAITYLQYDGFSTPASGGGSSYTNTFIPRGSRINISIDWYRAGTNYVGDRNCNKLEYNFTANVEASQDYTDIIGLWNGENVRDLLPNDFVYNSTELTTTAEIIAFEQSGTASTRRLQWFKNATDNQIKFLISGYQSCASGTISSITSNFQIFIAGETNLIVFETEPTDALPDVWYEGQDSYPIDTVTGYHLDGGNFADLDDQGQSATQPAILHLNFSNCYAFGNGVESYTVRDSVKGRAMSLGNRVTTVSEQDYKRAHRSSDITYSGIYNDETNLNRLNEFNLGLANFKALEDSFGPVNKLFARETNILALQEDKISYVLSGTNLLSDASGGGVLTSVPEVLGKQIARIEDYGISDNTESFASYGSSKFFTDAKRGAVIQLKGDGPSESLNVISELGMRSWFRDLFTDSFETQKLGGYDPYMNEYVLSNNDILLPKEEECIPCGQRQTFSLKPSGTKSFCVDLLTTLGDVPFIFSAGADEFTVSINWDGSTSLYPSITGNETRTLNKDKTTPTKALISIQNNSSENDATIDLTSGCPEGTQQKIRTIVLTNNSDAGKVLNCFWSYDGGTSEVFSPDNIIEFTSSTDAAHTSFYQTYIGNQGQGSIPVKGNDVTIRTSAHASTFYNLNNIDRFLWLNTDTDYANTSADLFSLVTAATSLTPNNNGANEFSATFNMPTGAYEYLYLVWDLRRQPESFVCFDASSLADVCCECSCSQATTTYTVTNSGSTTITVGYNGGSNAKTLLGNSSVDVCSTDYPTFTPVTAAGVTITVKDCDC